jgi:hypothetical protein
MKLSVNRLTVVASSLAVAAMMALGCSKSSSPTVPTDRGVNITVDAKALSSTELGMVTVGSLIVTGDELQAKTFSVVPQISTGQLTFQYLPKASTATAAMLTFTFEALGDTGLVYGSGMAGPITLAANAVSVTITLAKSAGTTKGLGATCAAASDCGSGFCTDGVCCQEACKADVVCASCALTNTKGLCAPYAANTDPEKECVGFSTTTGTGGTAGKGGAGGAGGAKTDAGAPMDASASDAEPINPPDGGIMATPGSCGGTCNGTKACAFASPATSCGKPFCNTRKDVASPVCDGKGSCGIGLSDCTNGYACDPTAKPSPTCHTNCNSNSDCTLGHYCNGTTSMCAPTKVDGLTCATDAECLHNHCAGAASGVSGVCCNTACDSPFTCNGSGSAGTCKCPGVATCATGVSCAVFYPDADGDGYGDKTASLTTNTAKAACADSSQPGFVLDNTDCDDHDANVHPGQTAFFGTASNGIKTFDYDCDGTLEKGVAEYPGASCTFCPSCSACAPGSTTCSSSGAQASLACPLEGGICLSTLQSTEILMSVVPMSVLPAATIVSPPPIIIKTACCGCNDHAGFNATVTCGQSGSYVTCGTCGASGVGVGLSNGTATGSVSKQQLCR